MVALKACASSIRVFNCLLSIAFISIAFGLMFTNCYILSIMIGLQEAANVGDRHGRSRSLYLMELYISIES